jgi:hypothetical protein
MDLVIAITDDNNIGVLLGYGTQSFSVIQEIGFYGGQLWYRQFRNLLADLLKCRFYYFILFVCI